MSIPVVEAHSSAFRSISVIIRTAIKPAEFQLFIIIMQIPVEYV